MFHLMLIKHLKGQIHKPVLKSKFDNRFKNIIISPKYKEYIP